MEPELPKPKQPIKRPMFHDSSAISKIYMNKTYLEKRNSDRPRVPTPNGALRIHLDQATHPEADQQLRWERGEEELWMAS